MEPVTQLVPFLMVDLLTRDKVNTSIEISKRPISGWGEELTDNTGLRKTGELSSKHERKSTPQVKTGYWCQLHQENRVEDKI